PTGRVLKVDIEGEEDPRLAVSRRGIVEFTTFLPEAVGRYALRFTSEYDDIVAGQDVVPFNCMTFATEAVFGGLQPDATYKIFESMDPLYGHDQMRDVSPDEQYALKAGAMYGIASNLDILRRPLLHAFVGLSEPDRHFGVTHRGGHVVVDSTAQVLEAHIRNLGPARLVHFPEPPQ